LPRITIEATFGEAVAAMGLADSDHAPGDLFTFDLILNLTDGRVFNAGNAGGIITGGFFASPFQYNALIVCSPEPGDYAITAVDNYGDGWQGDVIRVNIDGVANDFFMTDYWSADPATRGSVGDPMWTQQDLVANIPVGTGVATWEYLPGSFPGEVEFEIFDPFGNSFGYFGPNAAPGLLPVLLCAQ
jgi:hypothetical protein